jgi:NADH-quinone oxidoreductase subunit B
MGPVLKQLYNQMPDPKWVIAMGACASTGGIFNNYAVIKGVDKIVPVEMYVPGCPPRPEQLLDGLMKLHEKVRKEGLHYRRA